MTDRFADGTPSLTAVLRPKGGGWWEFAVSRDQQIRITNGYPVRYFFYPQHRLSVFSAVEYVAEGLDRLEYHLSVSKKLSLQGAARCTGDEARWALAEFGLDGAEEDNHVAGGVVRNYWRPVAHNLVGLECPCKTDEPAIAEDKGDYVWRHAGDT